MTSSPCGPAIILQVGEVAISSFCQRTLAVKLTASADAHGQTESIELRLHFGDFALIMGYMLGEK